MKFSPFSPFRGRPSGLLKIPTTVAVAATLSACASLDFRQSDSSLPIESVHASSGQVASARALSSDRLYVARAMKKSTGSHIHYAAHVDVQLLAPTGSVIAERQDDIDPTHPKREQARGGRHSYMTSFPLSQAPQAAKIRIFYHANIHSEGNS